MILRYDSKVNFNKQVINVQKRPVAIHAQVNEIKRNNNVIPFYPVYFAGSIQVNYLANFSSQSKKLINKINAAFATSEEFDLKVIQGILEDLGINYNPTIDSKKFFTELRNLKSDTEFIQDCETLKKEESELQKCIEYTQALNDKKDALNNEIQTKEAEKDFSSKMIKFNEYVLKTIQVAINSLKNYCRSNKMDEAQEIVADLSNLISKANTNIENVNMRISECSNSIQTTKDTMKDFLHQEILAMPAAERKYLDDGYLKFLQQSDTKKKYFVAKNELARTRTIFTQNNSNGIKVHLGNCFENLVAKEVDRIIIPKIAKKIAEKELKASLGRSPGEEELNQRIHEILPQLIQLRNVRIGKVEFDHVIVRNKDSNYLKIVNEPEVVGIVESKYNLANITNGYDHRKQNLLYLNGMSKIPVKHTEQEEFKGICIPIDDKLYVLTQNSFKNINPARKNRIWQDKLYFICTYREPKSVFTINDINHEMFTEYTRTKLNNNLLLINQDISDFSLADIFIDRYISKTAKKNR